MELKVHLVFAGTCESAFNFYQEIFKGEIIFLFRKKEDPTQELDETEKEKISHIILKTEQFELSGEDAEKNSDITINSTKLILVFRDMNELKRVFNALAVNGQLVTPLHKEFFTECSGELIDQYGIRWLIMMTDENYED